jgi:hypothetical protein
VAQATTLYRPPDMPLAVNGPDAMPEQLFATVMVAVEFENTPLVPEPGAANVTATAETGLLPASFTVTASVLAKAVETVADRDVVPALADRPGLAVARNELLS